MAEKTGQTARIFSRASRSQQGDRLYFEDAARLTRERLTKLRSLKEEITESSDSESKEIRQDSFVSIKYQNGESVSFYFVSQAITLANIQLITSQSPLGKAIEGKKEKEKYSYQIKNGGTTTVFYGQILKVE